MLKFSLHSSFLNLFGILITNALIYGKLYTSVPFLQGLSLALSPEMKSSVFSFCLTFSVSMELGTTVTYCSLEGVSLCGSIVSSLCVPGGFGGRAGCEMIVGHDSYQLSPGGMWGWR